MSPDRINIMKNILLTRKNDLAYITIDRPDKLNALNTPTMEELSWAFEDAAGDAAVKAVILTGAGEKSFVAGADIKELATFTPLRGKNHSRAGQKVFSFIENMSKPVIAAVNGYALGGGCELAMACHLRIASENAKFGQPEINLGLMPGYGGTQRLPRLVGKGVALEMMLTGKMINAEEALRIGLVNRVVNYTGLVDIEKDGIRKQVPDYAGTKKKLMEEAEKLAAEMTKQSSTGLASIIEAVNRGSGLDTEAGQEIESDLFGLVLSTGNHAEGIDAFLNKRPPVWKD